MINEIITKICERCGAEVKVPEEYFDHEDAKIFGLCQVECKEGCNKIHTFNSHTMKWLR